MCGTGEKVELKNRQYLQQFSLRKLKTINLIYSKSAIIKPRYPPCIHNFMFTSVLGLLNMVKSRD